MARPVFGFQWRAEGDSEDPHPKSKADQTRPRNTHKDDVTETSSRCVYQGKGTSEWV